jgi:hypothetical protein
MSSRYSIKNTVKILTINKPNQKIRFQIRHPENVYAIIGIAVTCSLPTTKVIFGLGDVAGVLTLAIAEKGDVVFADDVKIDNNNYSDLLEQQLFTPFFLAEQYQSGKGKHYFETNYLVTDAMLEGYYEDVIFPKALLSAISAYKTADLYNVKIYIRYQTIKTEEA